MQKRTYLPAVVLFSFCLVACTAGMILLVPTELGSSPWEQFHVIAFPAESPVPEAARILYSLGEQPLDRYTATVEVENFSGRLDVPVAALPSHFEPDDPRYDPFLRALPDLFVGRAGDETVNLIYLPRGEKSLGRRYLELSRALRDYPFRLAGWDPLPALASALTALVVMAGAVAATRRRRRPVLAAIVPLMVYAFAGGPMALVRGTTVVFIWALWQDRGVPAEREWLAYGILPFRSREYRYYSFILLVVFLASFFTFLADPPERLAPALFAFILFLGVIFSLSALAAVLVLRRLATMEHRLFIPRPILPDRRFATPPRALMISSALLLLAAPVLVVRLIPPDDLVLPVPHRILESETVAARVLEEARLALSEDSPLSTAGYLAHRRYQESLLFGGSFSVPAMDEVVALVRFARAEGRIRDFYEPMITFDGDWVYRQLSPEPWSAYHLVVQEGAFLVFTTRTLTRNVPPPGRLLYLFFPIIVGFGPLMHGLRLPYRSRIGTVGFAPRRASQVA